jgi:hypothetical protein
MILPVAEDYCMTTTDTGSDEERKHSPFQRVVRTDFYFDPTFDFNLGPTVDGQRILVSAISAVWLKYSASAEAVLNDFRPLYISTSEGGRDQQIEALACLSALLRAPDAAPDQLASNVRRFMTIEPGGPAFAEQRLAFEILNQSIIVERSPPVAEVLSTLVHGATSTSLGILIGTSFTSNPYVMVITIPLGIILMGTALGISKGLERGIAKRVERAVNPSTTRRKTK